jgi:hypothetical protein
MPSRGYRKGVSDSKVALPREITVARYLRALVEAHLRGGRTQVPQARANQHALIRQLARVGNNLNQLVRQAHAGIVPVRPEELQVCLANLNALVRKI